MHETLKRFLLRRRYLVNRELQLKLLYRSVMAAAVMFLIMGMTLFLPLVLSLQTLDAGSEEQSDAAILFLSLNDRFLPVALLTLLAAGLCSLRSSHKIAGPLHRITDTFRRVRTGVLPDTVTTCLCT